MLNLLFLVEEKAIASTLLERINSYHAHHDFIKYRFYNSYDVGKEVYEDGIFGKFQFFAYYRDIRNYAWYTTDDDCFRRASEEIWCFIKVDNFDDMDEFLDRLNSSYLFKLRKCRVIIKGNLS